MSDGATVLGVVSDTHGLVRPAALAALAGVAHIVHAGDVGGRAVYDALAAIAPVTAVRGNNDRDPWGRTLPESAVWELAGRRILVLHDQADLKKFARVGRVDVVVTGHSHRPSQRALDGVLHLNPGAAGPRRFSLPISLARLHLRAGETVVEFVELSA